MDEITIDDFIKLELKVGTILEVEEIEESEKLLKLKVDLGEETPRQVLSGIKKSYSKETLEGTQAVFVANLAPRMMMGLESQAMIMATGDDDEKVVLLRPESPVPPGSKIR